MSTYELIEQSVLDALGILEPDERVAFEAALAQASPEVRAQVREEQSRLLDLEDLLPDESPRPELRELVLAAVRAAITEESSPVLARVGAGTMPALLRDSRPTFRPAKRVSRMWRAAAVAMGAAFVGMSAVTLEVNGLHSEIRSRALVDALYEQVGAADLDEIVFGPESKRVVLTSVTNAVGSPKAAVWHDPDWKSARLFISHLRTEPNERLRLVVIDDDGTIIKQVREFQSTGELTKLRVEIDMTVPRQFAICREADNEVLLTTLPTEL